ncbi:MAG: hypothetical protein ACI8PZ_000937 [Myxococcota bacterium]|jgi:hypothetical protein
MTQLPFPEPAVAEHEARLLALADRLYVRAGLRPMSKVLFTLSRLLWIAREHTLRPEVDALVAGYARARAAGRAPVDDYDLATCLADAGDELPALVATVEGLRRAPGDVLGLALDTLLRGRWEAGEGLGTFITPEEVTGPASRLAGALAHGVAGRVGDPCSGTGRFGLAMAVHHPGPVWLSDTSSLACGFARINADLQQRDATVHPTPDGLVDPAVTALAGTFAAIGTNPPFGARKYPWSDGLHLALGGLEAAVGTTPDTPGEPATLFLLRDLDLLAEGGVLAIVLPSGPVHSPGLVTALHAWEAARGRSVAVHAVIDLPTVTFSLAGTVARTTLLVLRIGADLPLWAGVAQQIGFSVKSRRRLDDGAPNDLDRFVDAILADAPTDGLVRLPSWRGLPTLQPGALGLQREAGTPLSERATLQREFAEAGAFHISVLDVDPYGAVDVVQASANAPTTRPLACQPGDVLLSLLNPRIWRVTVVPDLPGRWTCSPEFAVLRPAADPWTLWAQLHTASARAQLRAVAKGTSSSRQRVPKDSLAELVLPEVAPVPAAVSEGLADRYRADLHRAALVGGLSGD